MNLVGGAPVYFNPTRSLYIFRCAKHDRWMVGLKKDWDTNMQGVRQAKEQSSATDAANKNTNTTKAHGEVRRRTQKPR